MSTRQKDIPEIFEFRDTDHAHPSGVARMALFREAARIEAAALALYYRATGNVSKNVPAELEDAAYDVRRRKVNPLGSIDRFATILLHRATKRTLSRFEARQYAEQMLEYARQLIDLKLPVTPDGSTPGRQTRLPNLSASGTPSNVDWSDRERRGGGGNTLGSVEDYAA